MTVFVVEYDPATGAITGSHHEADHDYVGDDDELVFETYPGDVSTKRVDTTADPPELVNDPDAVWQRPGVVDPETRDLIADAYRSKGADALDALDDMEANDNIPPEVVGFAQASLAMQYLTYVSLTADRISAVESRFFG